MFENYHPDFFSYQPQIRKGSLLTHCMPVNNMLEMGSMLAVKELFRFMHICSFCRSLVYFIHADILWSLTLPSLLFCYSSEDCFSPAAIGYLFLWSSWCLVIAKTADFGIPWAMDKVNISRLWTNDRVSNASNHYCKKYHEPRGTLKS